MARNTKQNKENKVGIKKPSKKQKKNPDHSVLLGWLEFADQAAKTKQWDFFVIDQFLRGNHNISGNMEDNTIDVDPTDYIAYPINKMYANFRAVRSFVTRHKPKIEVEVAKKDEQSIAYARRANVLLERDNRLNNSRKLNKEWAFYGVKYGVGWRQIGFDKTKKVTTRWTIDPNNMLVGSKTGKHEDAPYIIKNIIRTVGYWKEKYPKANIIPDNKIATNEYHELSRQIEMEQEGTAPQRDTEQTMVGHECWYRVFEPNSMGGTINKVLFTEQGIIDETETPYNEYPFVVYEADTTPNELYPEGHMKHLISPQRMLNQLNKDLLEYNFLTNKGTYQYEKGSGFEVVEAKEGRMLRHDQGKPIVPVPPPPLNPALQWQMQYADDAMQIIGAQNDASAGRTPFAGASGDLVEALQTADSNSILELRENFEDALALEAQMILKMYSLFEAEGLPLQAETSRNEIDQFVILGSEAVKKAGTNLPKDGKLFEDKSYMEYTTILTDNNVKVSLSSELGETKEARLNLMVKLAQLEVIPTSLLLKFLEFPNVDDIERELAEEAAAEIQRRATEQALAPQPGATAGPIPQSPLPNEV